MKLLANDTCARFDDGTVWPIPSEQAGDIEWQLRYGDPMKVRLQAASILSAYRELIRLPMRQRNRRISELRMAASRAAEIAKLCSPLPNRLVQP